jgi:hypothetical protein
MSGERSEEDRRMQNTRSSPQRRAADLAARDRTVMKEIQKEQEERDRKTARLRALRLAKEAADKASPVKADAERLLAAEDALKSLSSDKKPPRRRRKTTVKMEDPKEQSAAHD